MLLIKAGGPLGLSIIGGSDHSCVPFGTGEPGNFISKVSTNVNDLIFLEIGYFVLPYVFDTILLNDT